MKLNEINDELFTKMKEYLEYNSDTGFFYWKKNKISAKAGTKAGTIKKNKYKEIRFNMIKYQYHRLAWLFYYNEYPMLSIDHIDGDPSNNKINNLRTASHKQNMQNRTKASISSKTGFLGVVPKGSKFIAQISNNYKVIKIGIFESPELAHTAYLNKKREIHEHCSI